ncbi:MAG: segregation/condensation protein A [Alphaproteobacteria bacterium]|nr:segregation/condensation protein A [Alphaproteobacteria bacterium]
MTVRDTGQYSVFDDDPAPVGSPGDDENLVVDIDGFEGPLDVLLALARSQKVDLKQISILELVQQFLDFVAAAKLHRLEKAADYLVMAAWLAYLKSRLLLPEENIEEEYSAGEMAARLSFHLQRLNAMRRVAATLMSHNQLGRDVFARGRPEPVIVTTVTSGYEVSFYQLLRAYADHKTRKAVADIRIHQRDIYSLDQALDRLRGLIGDVPDWTDLFQFIPESVIDAKMTRSVKAGLFTASLEMTRGGSAEIIQKQMFGPVFIRKRDRKD